MDKIANLSSNDRRELFQETAARKGINPAIVEKDFWVCWVLKQLFFDPQLRNHLIFKGGTSLSKVFGLIERFSEDIDLVLDWRLLGFGTGLQDPYEDQPSRTQQDLFNKTVNQRAGDYIFDTLGPRLSHTFRSCPGITVAPDPLAPHAPDSYSTHNPLPHPPTPPATGSPQYTATPSTNAHPPAPENS